MTKEEMIGTYVLLNKNGVSSIGKIKSITQEQNDMEYLNVQFENSEKKFPFPDIIAPKYSLHFLFVDKDVRVFVENLFREKYSKSQTSEPSPTFDNVPKKDIINSDNNYVKQDKEKTVSKSNIVYLFYKNGYEKFLRDLQHTTCSSINQKTNIYWANPKFSLLKEDWILILNNRRTHELYLFFIPANSIAQNILRPRHDRENRIDLNIMYNDSDFTDKSSKYVFTKFFIAKLNYTEQDKIYG